MKRNKVIEWINLSLIFIAMFYMLYNAYSGPIKFDEIDSNALPLISLQYRGSVIINESDLANARKDFPTLYANVNNMQELRCSGLIKISEEKWMSYYFPVYPLFCIPVKVILGLLNLNQERTFLYTNALLISFALFFLNKKLNANSAQRLFALVLLILSPAALYYVNYINYEVFIFSMLIVSLVQFYNGKYNSSAFVLSLAGMANSAVMAVGIVMVCEYLAKILWKNRGKNFIIIIKKNVKKTMCYGMSYIPCLIPFAMQHLLINRSIFSVTSESSNNIIGRFLSYLFDPTLGLSTFAPVTVIIFLLLLILSIFQRKGKALVWGAFLFGTVFAVSLMKHINCGMIYCARYMSWIYPIVPIFLATEGYNIIRKEKVKRITYSCAVLCTIALFYVNRNDTRPFFYNSSTTWLLNYIPQIYNPLSSTFYCRTLHIDGAYDCYEPAYYKNNVTDEITKLIFKASPGTEEEILRNLKGDEESLQYLQAKIEQEGLDGKFHYVNFPVWGRYKVYEKSLEEKGDFVAKQTLVEDYDFSLSYVDGYRDPTLKYQGKNFAIKIKRNTWYKIELELGSDFDFDAPSLFFVDFWGEGYDRPQQENNTFLVKDRYNYTFYFDSGDFDGSIISKDIAARIISYMKNDDEAPISIKKFIVTELRKSNE